MSASSAFRLGIVVFIIILVCLPLLPKKNSWKYSTTTGSGERPKILDTIKIKWRRDVIEFPTDTLILTYVYDENLVEDNSQMVDALREVDYRRVVNAWGKKGDPYVVTVLWDDGKTTVMIDEVKIHRELLNPVGSTGHGEKLELRAMRGRKQDVMIKYINEIGDKVSQGNPK